MKAFLSRFWRKYICDRDPYDEEDQRYWRLRRNLEAATALREQMQDSIKRDRT